VPLLDQRGAPFARVVGGRIDIGAFEVQGTLPPLVGDYNGDGTVNAADYTIWRDTLGSTTDLRANGDNSNNVIDAADYGVWRVNFGDTSGAGSQAEGGGVSIAGDLRSPESPEYSSAALANGADTTVRRRSVRAARGGQECQPHDDARMYALVDLLDAQLLRGETDVEISLRHGQLVDESDRERAIAELGVEFSSIGVVASL
jgi:hypothetical protein